MIDFDADDETFTKASAMLMCWCQSCRIRKVEQGMPAALHGWPAVCPVCRRPECQRAESHTKLCSMGT